MALCGDPSWWGVTVTSGGGGSGACYTLALLGEGGSACGGGGGGVGVPTQTVQNPLSPSCDDLLGQWIDEYLASYKGMTGSGSPLTPLVGVTSSPLVSRLVLILLSFWELQDRRAP